MRYEVGWARATVACFAQVQPCIVGNLRHRDTVRLQYTRTSEYDEIIPCIIIIRCCGQKTMLCSVTAVIEFTGQL